MNYRSTLLQSLQSLQRAAWGLVTWSSTRSKVNQARLRHIWGIFYQTVALAHDITASYSTDIYSLVAQVITSNKYKSILPEPTMIRGLFKSLSIPKSKRGSFASHDLNGLGQSARFISSTFAPIRSLTQSCIPHAQREETQPMSGGDSTSRSQPLKELKDMPGPWKVPLLGLSPELMADPKQSIQLFSKLPQKYGKIFKVKLLPGMPELVCAFDPEDAKIVFRNESKYPQRLPLEIWEESRIANGKPMGLFLLWVVLNVYLKSSRPS